MMRKRQIYFWNSLRFLRRHLMMLFSLFLFAISYYYFAQVQQFRASISRTEADAFTTDDIVTIKAIRDGDEIVVTKGDDQALVRILGIQSFDPDVNDPAVARIGKSCFEYLKANYGQRKAQITLGKTKVDASGRLLAYIAVQERPGSQSYNFDIGEDLLRRGLTQVYLRYPFGREQQYLKTEGEAESKQVGMWGVKTAADRANAQRKSWMQQRQKQ